MKCTLMVDVEVESPRDAAEWLWSVINSWETKLLEYDLDALVKGDAASRETYRKCLEFARSVKDSIRPVPEGELCRES